MGQVKTGGLIQTEEEKRFQRQNILRVGTLQCSCLENPRDGGAWWAAVYGVAQSRTRLKGLSMVILMGFIRKIFL